VREVTVRYLSGEDVLSCRLPMAEVIDLVERALSSHGKGEVECPPKPGIHPRPGTFIHAMPAHIRDLDIAGIKWVSGYPQNHMVDLPQILGVLVLNDPETGVPVCIMDCRWVTAVRTAAVSAVTAKYFANPGSRVLGIIGTGVQARYHVEALNLVVPGLTEVQAFDVRPEALRRFADHMSGQGLRFTEKGCPRECVVGAQIVLTATQRVKRPLVEASWVGEGTLGLGLEAFRAWHPGAVLSADRLVTDDLEQTRFFASQGAFPGELPAFHAELGEVVTGKKAGREDPAHRVLAINIGLALEDLVVAQEVYRRALCRGIGVSLPLMAEDV